MHNKLLSEVIDKYPITSPAQNIIVNIPATPDIKMPPLKIDFSSIYKDKAAYIERCHVTITNRPQNNLKEYPLEDIGAYIYYNDNKQIAQILFIAMDLEETAQNNPEQMMEELEVFLESVKDIEAIQAYRACAFYWCSFEGGFRLLSNDIKIEFESTQDDL